MFSRRSKYGLIACVRLARGGPSRRLMIDEIADMEKLPRKFLGSILLDLRYAGILDSKKGRGGGYFLSRKPEAITMGQILTALEGPLVPFRCIAIRSDKTCEECLSAPLCPIRVSMTHIASQMQSMFGDVSLAVLAQDAYRLENLVRAPVASQRGSGNYEKFECLDNL